MESAGDAGELAPEVAECLPTMAQSLRSLEQRLGLDTDGLVQKFTLCLKCGTRCSEDQIKNARSPSCTQYWTGTRCNHPLYEESTLYGGVCKLNLFKLFPYILPILLIERILMWPGMRELMQHWRRNEEPVDDLPTTKEDW